MTEESKLLIQKDTNPIGSLIDRIGYGKFQYLLMSGICILVFADGAEVMLITVISYILEEEWGLSSFEVGLLGAAVLMGMGIGYQCSSVLEDTFGRVKTIYISVTIILMCGTLSAFMPEIWSLSILRMLVGFGISFSIPSALALATEMSPAENRGKFLMVIELSFSIGQLAIILLVVIVSSDLKSGNWRLIIILGVLPVIPAIIVLYFGLIESPLYLGRNQRYQQAIANLNIMAIMNSKETLSEEEEESLRNMNSDEIVPVMDKYKKMFDKEHLHLTLEMIALWLIYVSSYYSIMFLLPFYLEEGESSSTLAYELLIVVGFQVPLSIATIFFIEQKIFGRKFSMIYLSVIVVPLLIALGYTESKIVGLALLVIVLGLTNLVFSVVFVYTTEMYETDLRIFSLGVLNILARVVGSTGIYLLLYLFDIAREIPFLIIAGMYLIAFILALLLPYDSTGMHLDFKENS